MDYARIIITGASSGLGEHFARTLAAPGRELILIARRRERLEQLATELRTRHPDSTRHPGVTISPYPCDLADAAERTRLCAHLTSLTEQPTLLINNAGLGDYGAFAQADAAKIRSMMQVNMLATVELTHTLLPGMLRTGNAGIMNIASLAADVFLPDFALYAASKSFVAAFSEGLRLELVGSGVRVLAVCPGPVHTEFGSVARRAGYSSGDIPLKPLFYTSIPTVVQGSLKALAAGRPRYYPSLKIRIAGCILRCMPLWLLRTILRTRPRRVTIEQGGAA